VVAIGSQLTSLLTIVVQSTTEAVFMKGCLKNSSCGLYYNGALWAWHGHG